MRIKNLFFIALGFVSLGLGAIGVVLPLLPTTPLVLLASILFSVGSPRFSRWLDKSRIFGPYIENYRTKQGISIRRKAVSIIYLWIGLFTSMLVLRATWSYFFLAVVGVCVTVHLLLIKTKKKEDTYNERE